MSDLLLRIQNDLVDAMKKRDDLRLSVLRMLKSAAQMAQIEKGKDIPLTDDEVLVLVRRLIKQRNEAAEMYRSGGAPDRAQTELDEIKVLVAKNGFRLKSYYSNTQKDGYSPTSNRTVIVIEK